MTLVRLLAALALCAGVWGPASAKDAPRSYERVLSPHSHAYRQTTRGEPVRRGRRAERYELRHGDCGGSDCANPRYRSEVRMLPRATKTRVGQEVWYGWSFRNGTIPSFTAEDTLRIVTGQFRLNGRNTPAIRLVQMGVGEGNWSGCDPAVCNRGGQRHWDVALQLEDMRRASGWKAAQNAGHVCRLFSMAEARGQWQDIVLHTNFAAGPEGYVRVWINGELRCDYRGQVVATIPPGREIEPLMSRGIFASYTVRWDRTRGALPKPPLVAYYDEFREGRRREDVDVQMHDWAGRRPRS